MDYLKHIDNIPNFEDRISKLREKYGYPLKIKRISKKNHDKLYIIDDFYCEFVKLTDDIIDYLIKEYPIESTLFPPSKYCTNSCGVPNTDIKTWIYDHIRRNQSEPGRFRSDYMLVKGDAIYKAYIKCIEFRNAIYDKEEKEIQHIEKLLSEKKLKLARTKGMNFCDDDPH